MDPVGSLSLAVLDVALALTLVGVAWGALAAADLFKGVVLFIALGLLMALAWVRLSAPDLALAEAGIGAGLAGALLLAALRRLSGPRRARADGDDDAA
jgi:uncharacterized MnhB-related membrane protein